MGNSVGYSLVEFFVFTLVEEVKFDNKYQWRGPLADVLVLRGVGAWQEGAVFAAEGRVNQTIKQIHFIEHHLFYLSHLQMNINGFM